jgi:hypothetical protein
MPLEKLQKSFGYMHKNRIVFLCNTTKLFRIFQRSTTRAHNRKIIDDFPFRFKAEKESLLKTFCEIPPR